MMASSTAFFTSRAAAAYASVYAFSPSTHQIIHLTIPLPNAAGMIILGANHESFIRDFAAARHGVPDARLCTNEEMDLLEQPAFASV
jgi:hypothetical protein